VCTKRPFAIDVWGSLPKYSSFPKPIQSLLLPENLIIILSDMAKTLTVTEMARSFADYINRVVYRRESFVLTRGNKPVAEIRPLPVGRKLSELPAILAALPHLTPEEAEAFGRDIDEAREELNRLEVKDPWDA
jgi:antitoxin (DNA-binding transcriptional repressor) of toxin-antitoxin stability system